MKKRDNRELDIDLEEFPVDIANLVIKLADEDGMIRKAAREKLVRHGKEIIPYIHQVTETEDIQLRWEAGKILEQLGDVRSIPVLINLLVDEESDIRWIAAQGLINIGEASIIPLLREVKHHSDSIYVREGAHHVLWGVLDEPERVKFIDLLEALGNESGALEKIPIEAAKALKYFQ
jgi:HEAT repeat protein